MGIELLALASSLRWGTQVGVWSRLGGHGGITAAGDRGAVLRLPAHVDWGVAAAAL